MEPKALIDLFTQLKHLLLSQKLSQGVKQVLLVPLVVIVGLQRGQLGPEEPKLMFMGC